MDTKSLPEMIMLALANTQAEILCLKDFIVEDYIQRNNLNQEQADAVIDSYEKSKKIYQTNLIAQLKERYDTGLGSVDDLLNNLGE